MDLQQTTSSERPPDRDIRRSMSQDVLAKRRAIVDDMTTIALAG
jgi:hypothetical protein